MDLSIEELRVANEAICTLVKIKSTMAELLLKPAGVPREIYVPLLSRRDEATGTVLTKRQMAPLILEELQKLPDGQRAIRAMVRLTSEWTSFHLAADEFAARATMQKAREIMSTVETTQAREAYQRELAGKEELARQAEERSQLFRRESDMLLMAFDKAAQSNETPQRRGFLLQDLLNRAFILHELPVHKSFQRNEGAEQIDGAFKLEGWYYLVECRWRQKLADIRDLAGLVDQVGRSGKQTMGLFLSINGWSENVPRLLKQNPEKSIILMEGYDLRTALASQIDLRGFILAKLAKLNLEGEPFLPILEYIRQVHEGESG